MGDAELQATVERLKRLTTPEQIQELRRTIDATTARAVIQALPPVDRGAILICLAFKSQSRWDRWDSGIIDSDQELIDWWNEQARQTSVPSTPSLEGSDGQHTSRHPR